METVGGPADQPTDSSKVQYALPSSKVIKVVISANIVSGLCIFSAMSPPSYPKEYYKVVG